MVVKAVDGLITMAGMAEAAMAERVKEAVKALRGVGTTLFGSA